MLSSDEHAKFLRVWFHRSTPLLQDIYIAFGYFPPALSHFSLHRESKGDPFIDLYDDICHCSTLAEVILLVDFNARTGNLQVSLNDRAKDALCLHELEP
jgi:hypothetical protein